jgi:hemerythrin
MPIMNWDNALDVGVEAMNKEHRDILDAMNVIFDAHEAGQRGEIINKHVARLGAVCVRHFADEERFMEDTGFPGLNTHRLIHEKLLQDLSSHAASILAAGGTANEDFFGFLRRWLVAHIKGIDTKYGAYAKVSVLC